MRIITGVQAMSGSLEWILPVCHYLKNHSTGVEIIFLFLRQSKKEIFRDNQELEELAREISSDRCYDMNDLLPGWVKGGSRTLLRLDKSIPAIPFHKLEKVWFKLNWKILKERSIRAWINEMQPKISLMDNQNNPVFTELKKRGIKVGFFPTAPSFSFFPEIWTDKNRLYDANADLDFDFFLVDTDWTYEFFKS